MTRKCDTQVLRERSGTGWLYLRDGRLRRTRAPEHGRAIHAQSQPVEPHNADESPEKWRVRYDPQQLVYSRPYFLLHRDVVAVNNRKLKLVGGVDPKFWEILTWFCYTFACVIFPTDYWLRGLLCRRHIANNFVAIFVYISSYIFSEKMAKIAHETKNML